MFYFRIQEKKRKIQEKSKASDCAIITDCVECNSKFSSEHDQTSHFMMLHPEQIFTCPTCSKTICGPQEVFSKHLEFHKTSVSENEKNNSVKSNVHASIQEHENSDMSVTVINLGEYNPNLSKQKAAIQKLKILTKATDHPNIRNDMKRQVMVALTKFLSNDQPHAISKQLGREIPLSETDCKICLRKCISKHILERHLIKSHKPDICLPQCSHCDKILPLYGTEAHLQKKHAIGNHLLCRLCDTEFAKTGIEQPHMFLAPQIPCTVSTCTDHFSTSEALANHTYYVHKICNYHCDFCDKGFKNPNSIANHILSKHLKTGPTICEICGRNFTTESGLKVHRKNMHTIQQQCICDICGKMVPKYALKSHVHNHFYYSQRRECESCHKILKIKAWHRHKKYHAKHGPDSIVKKGKKTEYAAGYTPKQVKTRQGSDQLTSNNRGVVGPKERVQCAICHKFYLKGYLKTHVKHHFNVKDFECALCDKKYAAKNALTSHIQEIHLKSGHRCQYCNKFFYRKGCLLSHEALHRGERNFKCPHCPKSFPGKRNVYTHIWQVHKVKKKQLPRKVPKLDISKSIVDLSADQFSHNQIVSIEGTDYVIPDVIVNIDAETCEISFKATM